MGKQTCKRLLLGLLALLALLGLSACACTGPQPGASESSQPGASQSPQPAAAGGLFIDRLLSGLLPQQRYEKSQDVSAARIRDNAALYTDDATPVVLYMTVTGSADEKGVRHTWEELSARPLDSYAETGEEPWRCAALVQFGNETGPVFGSYGFSDTAENATVRLSGARASLRQQKSYRVELNENNGNINGMKEFLLSKSFTDPFRFTNKLAFDLLTRCDALLSTRTFFVHLYVRDRTASQDALFTDYGLYTMIEPINKRYLKNRGLDSSGELYKAVNFDFGRHEDAIRQPTDAAYSAERFEALLEAKGSKDYAGLIAMLEAVNDASIPIERTVAEWFDADSLYSFLAVNLLLDNKDTDTENFCLYRPLGDNRFRLIPWDFDGALRRDYQVWRDPAYTPGWERGIFLYTDSLLFRRIMSSVECTNTLSTYITALHDTVFSGEAVRARAETLSATVLPFLFSLPDRAYARVTEPVHRQLVANLAQQVDDHFYAYYDSLLTPWPFHILDPVVAEDGRVTLRWEPSHALEGEVTYHVELSNSWRFEEPLLTVPAMTDTSLDAGVLPQGQYFLRVRARAESGYTQEAYEYYNTEKKTVVPGVLCFYLREGGL